MGSARDTLDGGNELRRNAFEMESRLPSVTRVKPVFHRSTKNAIAVGNGPGDLGIDIVPAKDHVTVMVAGRVTVDSSPTLRLALLKLLHTGATLVMVIDLSAVSYLDMSGLATLLELLKAAHQRSVTLRVTGIRGAARTLAEIAQLDTIFRAWGSYVEFR